MTTTLLHPDSPNPIEVEADRVALYVASGWVVQAPKQTTPVPDPKKK